MEHNNELVLRDIKIGANGDWSRISYIYDAPENFQEYIREDYREKNEGLYIELPGDASDIPASILAVPFVGVMLTATMLLDIDIHVEVLDEVFFNCLKKLKNVYHGMFRKENFNFNIHADRLERNIFPADKTGLFFTGGVDATSALIEKAKDRPLLINIWGGDIRLTDPSSHANLEKYLGLVSEEFGTSYEFIKTDAREMFVETKLDYLLRDLIGRNNNHDWWESIAHILSMASVTAPFAFKQRIKTISIGSSWDGVYLDSNTEEFDNAICYGNTHFEIVEEGVGRPAKIGNIIKFQNESGFSVELKSCWQRKDGVNCCHCEKCYRTIMGIVANHGDPRKLGFAIDDNTMQQIHTFLLHNLVNIGEWGGIMALFSADRDYWKHDPQMAWICDMKINSARAYLTRCLHKLKSLE